MFRTVLAVILVCAVPSSGAAQTIAASAADQARSLAAAQTPARHTSSTVEIVAGSALLATGFAMAMYGFGNPTGPAPDPTKRWVYPHRSALGFSGLGLAVGGGILAWWGVRDATRLPSVDVGPHHLRVQHRLAF